MTITLKKRSQAELLTGILIVMPFWLGTLREFLGLPSAIQYLLDAVWCLLLAYMFRSRHKGPLILRVCVWLFLIYTALVYLVQFQSPLYYLWGIRNNFRFYAAFFAFCLFLNQRDADDYFRLFDKLFWVDIAVSLVQFFLLEKKGDHLGGLFGVESGANGYTNTFFCIILTKSVIFYLGKKEKMLACVAKFVAAIIIAALAELKFFFVEAVLIIILAVLFTDFSWRKVLIICGGLVGILAGVMLLVKIFPNFTGFFSWEWMWKTAISNKGYTSSGDINRLNAISQINEYWLTGKWSRFFGMGLGNCDTAGFEIVNTPFFKAYGDMHYTWLSHAMMYLECGWIGLMFYFGFFVLVYFKALKIEKTCGIGWKSYCRITRIVAVLCLIISVYNSSLRMEAGYMAYFVLAVPFTAAKTEGGGGLCKC